jgi:energy-coupling factor transport system permease protein
MTWRTIGSIRESPLAKLDFRSKLMALLAITYLAFLWENPVLTAGLALAVLILCVVAGIGYTYVSRIMRLMLPFYAIVLLTHGFWNTTVGFTPLWIAPHSWPLVGGSLQLTVEGLAYGLTVVFRTLAMILAIPLLIFTTDLNSVIVGLVRMRVPYKVAFTFSATLRFVPLLLGEINGITEAQRLRGLAVENMSLAQRLKVYSRIAVPLILGAMTKSQQLEVVLASKAFSGGPDRTYLHESALRAVDWAVIAVSVAVLLAATWLRVTIGLGRFSLSV